MRSDGGDHRSASARSSPFFDDREGPVFNDVFGGRPKYTNSNTNNKASTMMNDFDYDFIFKSGNDSKNNNNKTSSIFAKLIGMAARDLHSKYPKVLAGYKDIAKQRHGIDSTASQNCILRDHDSKLFILSYG
nr:auxilin-related protein 2-like [Ipomoea batatas]